MGHYSLFPLFLAFNIGSPAISAEAYATTTCTLRDNVAVEVENNVAFPLSCMIRFQFPQQVELPPFELFWYDGGMRPFVPDELRAAGKSLPREGMMFVGDKGKIIAGFRGEDPVLIPESKMNFLVKENEKETERSNGNDVWISAFRNKTQTPGSFLLAGPVTETINLGAIALRAGKRVEYDTVNMKITNLPEANKYLTREYRQGWEL
jgi:hypothetical protein